MVHLKQIILTQNKIHQFYKRTSYILGGISLIVLVVPFGDYAFLDRSGPIFTLNLGFHFPYHLIRYAPLSQLARLKDHSIIKDLSKRAFTASSYLIIASCLFITITVISDVISTQDYYPLTGLVVVAGVTLGALKLNLELRGKK